MNEPAELRLPHRALDLTEYIRRSPAEDDCARLVSGSAMIYDAETGDLQIVYLVLDDDYEEVEEALLDIDFELTNRSGGMITNSRVFGHQPRNLPRRDFCTAAALAREQPEAHQVIARYADRVSAYYRQYNPARYRLHAETTKAVKPEWRLEDSVFTSGIINKNNPLMYHIDAGNFKNVWSNMMVFKNGVIGGHLAVPDYDVKFALPNNSLLMFDGASLLHGVTPIILRDEDAYRFSIVFYSLKQMWSCLPMSEEIARAQKRRTEREMRRAGLAARLEPDHDD